MWSWFDMNDFFTNTKRTSATYINKFSLYCVSKVLSLKIFSLEGVPDPGWTFVLPKKSKSQKVSFLVQTRFCTSLQILIWLVRWKMCLKILGFDSVLYTCTYRNDSILKSCTGEISYGPIMDCRSVVYNCKDKNTIYLIPVHKLILREYMFLILKTYFLNQFLDNVHGRIIIF